MFESSESKIVIKEFKQNTTAKAKRTSPNRKFNKENNGCACTS